METETTDPKQHPEGAASAEGTIVLTIYFQGLCTFVRNKKDPKGTTEVTALLVAAEKAQERPPLCLHEPVLVFPTEAFDCGWGPHEHFTAVLPPFKELTVEAGKVRPAVGVWPLRGKELRISGARRNDLKLDVSFAKVADFSELADLGGVRPLLVQDRASLDGIVSCRFPLTSGVLYSSAETSDQDYACWAFDREDVTNSDEPPAVFSQEVKYEYRRAAAESLVVLEAFNIATDNIERLELKPGRSVAITNLCAMDNKPAYKARDVLAYYHLLTAQPHVRKILHRVPCPKDRGKFPVRPGQSACPPGTGFVLGG